MAVLYKDLPEQSIRLFKLKYAANTKTPISGKLISTRLTPKVKYNALSYFWGKANNECIIKVSGVDFGISSNLDRALRQIRGQCDGLPIWVDQICIDGKNADEKARQVSLMGQIYSSAQEVLVILCACNLIEDDSRKIRPSGFPELIELSRLPLETHRSETCFHTGSTDDAMLMQRGVGCEWWTRMWTAQELIFARKLKFFNHGDNISGDIFQHFCDWYDLHMNTSCCSVGPSFSGMVHVELSNLISHARKIFAMRDSMMERRAPIDLLEALIKTQDRCATNPLDQIYALASLAQIPAGMIDYSLTPQKCYTIFAKYIIESSGCLDIFKHLDGLPFIDWSRKKEADENQDSENLTIRRTKGLDHLPSWVPDWSITRNNPSQRDLSLYLQNLDNYHAAADTTVCMSVSSDTCLILRGVKCGVIVKTSPVFAEMDFSLAAIMGIWATVYGIQSLQNKESVMSSIFSEGEYLDFSDDLLGCWQGGFINSALSLIEMRKKGIHDLVEYRLSTIRRNDPRAKLLYRVAYWRSAEADSDFAVPLLQSMHGDDSEDDKILAITNGLIMKLRSLGKHLIATSDGKLGVASSRTKAGDLVCVLYGGKTPFILREEPESQVQSDIEDFDDTSRLDDTTRCYRVISEAYVHGLMLGEAIEHVKAGRLIEEGFVLV